jgi:hypothetical protein
MKLAMNNKDIKTIDQLRKEKYKVSEKVVIVTNKFCERSRILIGTTRPKREQFWFSGNSILKYIGYTITFYTTANTFRKIIFVLKRMK